MIVAGILMIMLGVTGSQHEILSVFKGIPAAARGQPVTTASVASTQPANPNNGFHQVALAV